MNKILIVEDEKKISELIRMNLVDAGYECHCVYDGIEAVNIIENQQFDLILLDIMLPEINGYEVMEYVKQFKIPVIFLTAKSTLNDKVKGLKLGAEDYITKPFEIIELLARIETVLRRFKKDESIIKVEDLEIDILSRVVKKNGNIVNLTVKEYEILLLFIRNKNIALFRDQMFERVWNEEYMGDSRTVDLHVQRLRKKIGWEHKIVAVYKVGYRLEL